MQKIQLFLSMILSFWVVSSWAHGPVPFRVTCHIETTASPEKVWGVVGDFGALHEWHPAVKSTQFSGGNQLGGTRILTLEKGGTMKEVLKNYDAKKMMMKYRLTDMSTVGLVAYELSGEQVAVPVFPADNFGAKLTVNKQGKTVVTWRSNRTYRAEKRNEPPVEMNDATAKKVVEAWFREGLENLKQLLESDAAVECLIE